MSDVQYPRYPTDTEVRNTFSDEDEIRQLANDRYAKRHKVTLVRFEYGHGLEMTPQLAIKFASLADLIADHIDQRVTVEGDYIYRTETYDEAEKAVLNGRGSDMRYAKDSPHYSVHDPEFLARNSDTDSDG